VKQTSGHVKLLELYITRTYCLNGGTLNCLCGCQTNYTKGLQAKLMSV